MSSYRKAMGVVVAAALAVGVTTQSAGAQNININELAAAVALPVLTGGQPPNTLKFTQGDIVLGGASSINLLTITNGKSSTIVLRVDVISGDPSGPAGGDQWQSDSFDCLLTGRETVTFLVVPSPPIGSIIFGECTDFTGLGNNNVFFAAKASNGVFFAAAAEPQIGTVPPRVISEDILLADAVVIDTQNGQAFSFGAIPFQAGTGANDGNKVYLFNGVEYRKWPAALATNFIAPNVVGPAPPSGIQAELVLFTLDGSVTALAPPRVSVTGNCWNDDELAFDFSHTFDCFDVVSLGDMSPNCTQQFLGSLSGHLDLRAEQVGSGFNDSHDATFGDGNNSRRRPVHGWIVQNVRPNAPIVQAGQPTGPPFPPGQPNVINNSDNFVAWGRPLTQGRTDLVPFLTDMDPALDAE